MELCNEEPNSGTSKFGTEVI